MIFTARVRLSFFSVVPFSLHFFPNKQHLIQSGEQRRKEMHRRRRQIDLVLSKLLASSSSSSSFRLPRRVWAAAAAELGGSHGGGKGTFLSKSLSTSSNPQKQRAAGAAQDDIQSTLRRVNRRISLGVDSVTSGEVAKANAKWVDKEEEGKGENLLGKRPPIAAAGTAGAAVAEDFDDDSVVVRANNAKTTMIFLHGFGDTAPQWEAFARTLVRGMEEYVDVVLPSAPKRYYATNANEEEDEEETSSSGGNGKKTQGSGGELFSGRAWFAPRLLPSRTDYESILAEYEDLLDENQAELEKRSFSCDGMRDSFERLKRLVENEYPREVILSGFSQGAAMAVSLMCSGDQKPKNLVGCLSFRGYLPRKPDEMKVGNETTSRTSEESDDTTGTNNKNVLLMLAGESDPLVPVRWTKEAKVKAESLGLDVQAFFSEGYGHNVTSDDIYRARSWLRSRVVL